MSRKVIETAVDAFVCSRGETNAKEKWRFNKLEKLHDINVLERYWALELPHIVEQKDILVHAKECLRFANTLVLQIQKARKSVAS